MAKCKTNFKERLEINVYLVDDVESQTIENGDFNFIFEGTAFEALV